MKRLEVSEIPQDSAKYEHILKYQKKKKKCTFKTLSVKYLELNFEKLEMSWLKIHTYNISFGNYTCVQSP